MWIVKVSDMVAAEGAAKLLYIVVVEDGAAAPAAENKGPPSSH